MSPSTRAAVSRRAHNVCEYCRCLEDYSSGLFAVEHIVAKARGGSDDMSNLAWSCASCNAAKYDFIEGLDPETNHVVALFHPRQQRWSQHFRWSSDNLQVEGISPTGRATVVRMDLNRRQNINLRTVLLHFRLHPPLED